MSDAAVAGATRQTLPSFARGLFMGTIQEDLIFPWPELPADERESLDMVLETFNRFAADKLDAARFDREMEIPQEFIAALGELGVLGITVPEEYGGFGFSTGAYARLMETVCRWCAATATVVGGHQSIGIKGILRFGTEAQKQEFLPPMASGEWIGAYALTEPGSGSDAAAMITRAVYDPADDVWILNGSKQWITNGSYARVFTVFARTEVEGETSPTRTVSCFLVKADLPGVSTTPPMHKMGIRGSNTVDVVFDNVRVPAAHQLGRLGGGFKMAMEILNTGRLSLAAGCIGASKDMLEKATAHATQRKAFGTTISDFEMVRKKFAEMMVDTYAAESMVYMTTGLCDRGGLDFSMESAMCKVYASEALWRTVNHAVQTAGGNGYMSEYPFERVLRDSRINLIFEGTDEILRHYVATTGLKEPAQRTGAGQASPPATPQPLTRVHAALKDEASLASTAVARLAAGTTATLQIAGPRVVQKEHLQERLADAAMEIYGMLACLSRTTAKIEASGEDQASREITLTRRFCRRAAAHVEHLMDAVTTNDDAMVNAIADMAYGDGGYKLS